MTISDHEDTTKLRDQFAGLAMQAFVRARFSKRVDTFSEAAQRVARLAYGVADAMLVEREKE